MKKRALTLIGGLLLLAGLVVALIANHYEAKVLRNANFGEAVLAAREGSPELAEKQRLRREVEWLFWIGIGLTAVGVVLQTAGALLEE